MLYNSIGNTSFDLRITIISLINLYIIGQNSFFSTHLTTGAVGQPVKLGAAAAAAAESGDVATYPSPASEGTSLEMPPDTLSCHVSSKSCQYWFENNFDIQYFQN